jgi:Putative zinc-finger
MLSCKQSTQLMSQAQDRKLTVPERLQLEMHLALCKGCRNYRGQVDFLRQACRRYLDEQSRAAD